MDIYQFNIDDKCTVFSMLSDMISYFSANFFIESGPALSSSGTRTDHEGTDSKIDLDDRLCLIALCEKTMLPIQTTFSLSRSSLNSEIIKTLHFSLICIFAALKLQMAFDNRGPFVVSAEEIEKMPNLIQNFEKLLVSFVTENYGSQSLLPKLLNCARKGSSFEDCYDFGYSEIINGFVSLTSIIISQVTESQLCDHISFLPEKVKTIFLCFYSS